MRHRKPALGFIFVTLFLDILGVGLIVPILPKLVQQMQGGDIAAASHAVGSLGAIYALMQFLFAPVLGSLSDQFGRRPVILIALAGSALDYLLLAFAPTLPWFFIGRAVSGLSGANITAATAYIADISPPEKRAANFGVIGAAFGLGFIAGPLLGGLLGASNLRLPFLVAAILTGANWLYGYLCVPESLDREHRRPFSWSRANPVGSLRALREKPLAFGLAISLFALNLGQFCVHSTWVLYTGFRYGWGPREVGLSLAVVGLTAAVVQGGLARMIIPKLGEIRSIVCGNCISALALAGYGAAPRGWMIYAILPFGAFGGIGGQSAQALVSKSVGPSEQGSIQGAITSLGSIAGFLAPILATGLFGHFVDERRAVPVPGAPFFLGATLVACSLGIALRTIRKHLPKTGN
ncbi:MAG: TCR/Tet family MFS transporter [Verrucomicrobia bacterium]|nr:MAG: TCR/Tet family MFS transporter [Verrucomicrobiota bacterium]